MAGWLSWNSLQVQTGSSVCRTVLETLWPEVIRVANAQQWDANIWTDRLTAGLTEAILSVKKHESPILNQEDQMRRAVAAGEMFALEQFHNGVRRFDTVPDAVAWLMNDVRRFPARADTGFERRFAELQQNHGLEMYAADAQGVRGQWGNMTFDHFIIWVYYQREQSANSTDIAQALMDYVAGMSKMGTMSRQWIRSRTQQIRREAANPDVELDLNVCQHVWDFYGVAFPPPPAQWGQLFAMIQENCRAKGLTRLYVTALQSAEQGCTVLNLVNDAMLKCADFNWARFRTPRVPAERQIAQELLVFMADFTAMKDNPWLRFAGTAGRTPQMANLGYLARELLSKAKGQTSVDNYAGLEFGNLTITYRVWVDTTVNQYVRAQAERPPGAEQPVLLPAGAVEIRHPRANQQPQLPPAPPIVRPEHENAQANNQNGNVPQGGGGVNAVAANVAAANVAPAADDLQNAQNEIAQLRAQMAALEARQAQAGQVGANAALPAQPAQGAAGAAGVAQDADPLNLLFADPDHNLPLGGGAQGGGNANQL